MTTDEVLARATSLLRSCANPPRDAEADAALFLREAWGLTRAALLAKRRDEVPAATLESFERMVSRRTTGEPVQYIIGRAQFYRDEFLVAPGALIPRPETEIIVEAVVERLKKAKTPVRFLDLGTGSGCIALSVLRDVPHAQAVAVDVSPEALEIATENGRRLGLSDRCTFGVCDWFKDPFPEGPFDAIVSNPPYVALGDALPAEVARFEPPVALFPPSVDSLHNYRHILSIAPPHLVPGGFIAMEVGQGQAKNVEDLMTAVGLEHETTLADLPEIPRVVVGRSKG